MAKLQRQKPNKRFTGVYVLIQSLMGFAMKYDNEQLGKFHRDLAILLNDQDKSKNTPAGIFARELLELAEYQKEYHSRGGKTRAVQMWGDKATDQNETETDQETTETPEQTENEEPTDPEETHENEDLTDQEQNGLPF